jgi:hypothetical protein
MKKTLTLFAALSAAVAATEDVKTIPNDLTRNYFYAQLQYVQAKQSLDEAIGALAGFCGEKANPTVSSDPRVLICKDK